MQWYLRLKVLYVYFYFYCEVRNIFLTPVYFENEGFHSLTYDLLYWKIYTKAIIPWKIKEKKFFI